MIIIIKIVIIKEWLVSLYNEPKITSAEEYAKDVKEHHHTTQYYFIK